MNNITVTSGATSKVTVTTGGGPVGGPYVYARVQEAPLGWPFILLLGITLGALFGALILGLFS